MMRCHDCQTLLLDHAYGLLDAAEAASVQSHLAGCPACQAAFQDVGRAQGLFAQAAKTEFPNVRFVAPLDEAVVPFAPPRKARSTWVQWVVAASVLALIPGTMIPVNKMAERYESAKRDTEEAATRTAKAKVAYEVNRADKTHDVQLAAAEQKHLSVVSGWVNDAKAEPARKVSVAVTKPQSITPGAPNEYVVAIADPGDTLGGSRVEAQFRDQAGQVLHTEPVHPKIDKTVRLPAEVWNRVNPQSELFLSVSAVNAASGARTELQEPIRLYGPIYATLLTTDKTSYRPGEQLHFRSLTLDRVTLRTPSREQNLRFTFRKSDGTGQTFELDGSTNLLKDAAGTLLPILDAAGKPVRGIGVGSFLLPANLPEGEYTLTLTELLGTGGAAPVMAYPVTKSIQVRSGAPEKFAKELTFTSPTYKTGDTVTAIAELKLGDKPVVGAKGLITLASDGLKLLPIVTPVPQAKKPDGNPMESAGLTDAMGRFKISFRMPALKRNDLKLMVIFEHDGVKESVAKRVPVAGSDTTIEFFPEGGTLLAGVPNRVYVRGTTAAGKPVDVRGMVADGNELVAKVDASGPDEEPGVHRGIGSFTFTPKAGVQYQLRLAGALTVPLPEVKANGVVLTALDTVVKPGQPIRVRVHSVGKDRKLVVGAYTRGRLADRQTVEVKDGAAAVVTLLAQPDSRGGVTRITVFEEMPGQDLVPQAERLVFRKPGEILNLVARPTVTDGAVDLSIVAMDEKGNPVPAILWAAAVNSAMVPNEKHRALPTHFLLGGEVQTPDELEHADFLLTDHPKAADALDHVLATQGWRRFVEQQPKVEAGSPAEALLKLNGNHPTKSAGTPLLEKHWPQFESSANEVDAARQRKEATEPTMLKLYAEYETSRRATEDSATAVQNAAGPYDRIRDRLAIATGCVSLLTLMRGVLALARGRGMGGALPYFVGMLAAAGLAIYLTMDASRNPATVPVVNMDKPEAPRPSPPLENPNVQLPPKPKFLTQQESIREKSTIFGIGLNKVDLTPAGPGPLAPKPTIPTEVVAIGPFRAPPGQPILDKILDEHRIAKEKSEAFAADRALGTLRKIESALHGTGLTTDTAAAKLRDATPRMAPFVVREYAAPRPGSANADADTVMWKPVIVLPTDGRTTLHFDLGSAPGGYQVIVAGHSADGRLGSTKLLVK